MSADFIYEFTKASDLLEQYYRVREECYKEVWGLKIFSGAEDEHDRIGHILVVRRGNHVVGGARLVLSTPDSPVQLPLEDGFALTDLLPEYALENKVYGEVGRLSVLPEYGGKTLRMGRYLLAMAQLHQCQFLSTVAPEDQAKRYSIICKRLGLDVKIVNDITIQDRPYYNQIEMKLLLCDITNIPDYRDLIVE